MKKIFNTLNFLVLLAFMLANISVTAQGDACGMAEDISFAFDNAFGNPCNYQVEGPYTNLGATIDADAQTFDETWVATTGTMSCCACESENSGDADVDNPVWFSFTPANTGDYSIFALGDESSQNGCTSVFAGPGDDDTQMWIFTGTCGNLSLYDCNEDAEGALLFEAGGTFNFTAGTTYYLVIDGYLGADGNFCLEIANDTGSCVNCGDGICGLGFGETYCGCNSECPCDLLNGFFLVNDGTGGGGWSGTILGTEDVAFCSDYLSSLGVPGLNPDNTFLGYGFFQTTDLDDDGTAGDCANTPIDEVTITYDVGTLIDGVNPFPSGSTNVQTSFVYFFELTPAEIANNTGINVQICIPDDGNGTQCCVDKFITFDPNLTPGVTNPACPCAAGSITDAAVINQNVCADGSVNLCTDGNENLSITCEDGSAPIYAWRVLGDYYGTITAFTSWIEGNPCEVYDVNDIFLDEAGLLPPFTGGTPLVPGTYFIEGAFICPDITCIAAGFITAELFPAGSAECIVDVAGCMDPCDPNYDATATIDDPSLCAGYSNTCNTDCTQGPFGGTWDIATCSCINEITPVLGCTDPAFCEFDSAADCDDSSCATPNTDPGCDDGDCSNGVETWDMAACNCVPGIPPVDPGCDDGDCSNGVETWDGCDCVAGTPPVDPGCDDGDCTNGLETWDGCACVTNPPTGLTGCTDPAFCEYDSAVDCDDGSCVTPNVDPGCDDGDCSNGVETWDTTVCECVAGETPMDPGCDDGDCSNGVETWDGCDCVAGTPPVDPGCDDGDCANGLETWDGCACVSNPPSGITGCTDPAFCEYDPTADCDDGSCATAAPTAATIDGGPFQFCVDDGTPDFVSGITTSGGTGSNSAWVITDDQLNILGLPGMPGEVDFDGAGFGTCLIWYVTYEDLVGAEMGMNAGDLTGCFALSNSIEVVREDCEDPCEVTSAAISGGPFQFCVNDGTPDFVSGITVTGGSGTNTAWVITDDQLNILGLPGMPGEVDFDSAGFGTCLIWYVTYEDLVGAEMGMNAGDLTGCFALSNSIEVVREDCEDPCEATAATISGGPFQFCVNDGTADFVAGITVSGGTGANTAWVITDDQLNILGLPGMPGEVDFDGAGFGTCLIWYVTFEDLDGAVAGANAADLTGCFALSNSIEVLREDCGPCEDEISGTIQTEISCSVDAIAVLITDAAGNPVGPGMAITDASGNYTLTGGPYPCGEYIATMDDLSIPSCYSDAGGEVGPSGFTVNGDGEDDGADFSSFTEVPTLSQWGLISLALLLMTFGALKIGYVSNFEPRRKRA